MNDNPFKMNSDQVNTMNQPTVNLSNNTFLQKAQTST